MNTINQEMIDALTAFNVAAATLSEKWDNFGGGDLDNYPFENQFNDVVDDIDSWVTQSIIDIKSGLYENDENLFILNRNLLNLKKGTILSLSDANNPDDDENGKEYFDVTTEIATGEVNSYYHVPDEFLTLASREEQHIVSKFLNTKKK